MRKPVTNEERLRRNAKIKEYRTANKDRLNAHRRATRIVKTRTPEQNAKRRIYEKERRKLPEQKEKERIRKQVYAKKNPELVAKRSKDWIARNPEKAKATRERYRIEHAEERRAWRKEYDRLNRDNHRLRAKLSRLARIDHYRKMEKERVKHKRKTNPQYAIACRLRARVRDCLKSRRKFYKLYDGLGCTRQFLMEHLQAKFLPGMSWNNFHLWHIDHIRPLSSFDLLKKEEQAKAFHYSNLQPLWAIDNIKKGAKLIHE